MARSRWSVAMAGALVALLVTGFAPAIAEAVTLRLRPTGQLTLPQGAAFGFEVLLHNPGVEAVDVVVIIRLRSVEGGGAVAFFGSRPTIGPGETFSGLEEVTSSQWLTDLGTFEMTALLDGVPADRLRFEVTAQAVPAPAFVDVTDAAGLDTITSSSQCGSAYTGGAAWGDVEGDGDLDLYVPERLEPAHLWINDGAGHFSDEAAERGADNGGVAGVGAVFADYDNDGDQDLYVANDGPNRLYRNDGTGHFEDRAVAAGVATATADASASWGDYDDDGYLDLYVVSYTGCAPPDFYDQDRLFHNEGDGTFTDQTSLLPEAATFGAGFQAAWWDYDNDGDQDLYLANDDWGPQPDANHLWRNDGPGEGGWRFTDVSADSGAGFLINSMGIGIGDYDRDLDLDLAISNIGPTVLARNNGDGTFTDVAKALRVDRPSQRAGVAAVTWGLVFADLNLDGWEDLFVAAGDLSDVPNQPDAVFAGDGAGGFLDLTALSGAGDPDSGRGVAVADYDRDGLLDLYVVNKGGTPRLLRNVTAAPGYHWLEVDLTGTASNRDACGARLILVVGGARLLRQVFCGSTSLSSGHDTTVHFGLGPESRPGRLVIEWPSGTRQVVRRPSADRLLEITEP